MSSHLCKRASICQYTIWGIGKAKMNLPDEGDVFARHLFEVANGCGLSCKAVVGIIVCHNSGGTQFA